MKFGIIGTGAVGKACAFATVMRGCASELVLLDRDRKRARGVVTDLQYGAILSLAVTVIEGDYRDGHDRVLSTGTYLDSLRFQFHLAKHLGVSPASVEALVIGEHGTSEVFLWSGARVGGMPADLAIACRDVAKVRQAVEQDVRYANITIIEGISASQLGIGMVPARIAEIVLRDERAVVPIGVFNPKFGVTLSMPGILGRNGVSRILEPAMSEEELQGLQRSADTLKAASRRIGALVDA